MKLKRELFYSAILSMIAVTILFLALALYLDPVQKIDVTKDEIIFTDDFKLISKLKNNSLFDKTEIESNKIFVNITQECNAIYTLSVMCSKCNESGKYSVYLKIETKDWSKNLTTIQGDFTEYYRIQIPLDIQKYLNLYDQISTELGYRASDPKVVIDIITSSAGYEFLRTINLELDEKVSKISSESSNQTQTQKFVEREVLEVNNEGIFWLKYLLFAISPLPVIIVILMFLRVDVVDSGDRYGKYRDILINGKRIEKGRIELKNFEELLKLSEFLNKPIIRVGDEFAVIDGDTMYVAK